MNRLTAFSMSMALGCAALTQLACANAPAPVSGKPALQITALRLGVDTEVAFNTAVTAERAAKTSGFLKGATSDKADVELAQAYVILKRVRPLIDAGAHPDLSTFTALIGDVMTLSGKGN